MDSCMYCLCFLVIISPFVAYNAQKALDMSSNDSQILRRKRALGLSDFNKLQGNWKYSKGEIEQMFEDYYKCLNEYNKRENRINEAITAILALEGQRVELKCPTCLRPDQDTKENRLFWQRVRNADASTTHISSKTKGIKIDKDLTLVLESVDISDAGQYYCVKDGDSEVIYQVDVLFNEPQRTVSENKTLELLPAQKLVDHNVKVFTHWSEWGECDQCDKNGRRLKFGTCMVEKIDRNKPIVPIDIPIMTLYPSGVPCRSTILSRVISHLPGIGDRKSEVLQGYCYQPCPTTPPPIEVTDASGKVVEIIEGGYHPIDKKPELPPMVKRDVKHFATGSHAKISCPTSDKGKVRWQRGERPINPATIRRQTKGRVFIDKLNRLHIRKLRIRDSAPYSCWAWRRHVATIKVIAYEPMNEDIKHYITYGGLVITIVGIPLFCFCKLCFGKPKRRKR
ncbi:hypothetical protein ACF0H5_000790 [Mactra antiquata]